MRCIEIQSPLQRQERHFSFVRFSWNLMFWWSRMMNLGSEGVYLDENYRTNPSRNLPGPKNTVKK